jgi:hypothetical protein
MKAPILDRIPMMSSQTPQAMPARRLATAVSAMTLQEQRIFSQRTKTHDAPLQARCKRRCASACASASRNTDGNVASRKRVAAAERGAARSARRGNLRDRTPRGAHLGEARGRRVERELHLERVQLRGYGRGRLHGVRPRERRGDAECRTSDGNPSENDPLFVGRHLWNHRGAPPRVAT